MAMRCVHHLANADDIARQDSAARALGGGPYVPAQIEALNRYRNNGEPAITVQNVSSQMAARPSSATSPSTRA